MSYEEDKARHLALNGDKFLKSAEAFFAGKQASKETIMRLAQNRAIDHDEFMRKIENME